MMDYFNPQLLINSFIYSIVGIIMFWVSFLIIDKLTPYNLWGEIVEKKNVALAVLVGAMCLGIANIVASAIH